MSRNSERHFFRGYFLGIISFSVFFCAIISVLCFTGIISIECGSRIGKGKEEQKVESKLKLLKKYIDTYYMDSYKNTDLENDIYKGLVSGLGDRYSTYFTKQEYKEASDISAGSYCGIGVSVAQNKKTGEIYVVQVLEGGAAKKAGVLKGDVIYKINGRKVLGEDMTKVASLMKGKAGSAVKIEFLRKGEEKSIVFNLVRKQLESISVSYKMLPQKIGYIRVSSFEEATVRQFNVALKKLEKKDQKGMIIDLRDNGGGLLSTATSMLKQILPKGIIVYTKEKSGKSEEYYCDGKHEFKKPIVILVNGNTASASEVFSGAVRDYKKGILIGTKTFGKGIVQTIFPLSDGSAIKLTTAKYYSPKGTNIQGKGYIPDIEVPYQNTGKTDSQLEAAEEYLNNLQEK